VTSFPIRPRLHDIGKDARMARCHPRGFDVSELHRALPLGALTKWLKDHSHSDALGGVSASLFK